VRRGEEEIDWKHCLHEWEIEEMIQIRVQTMHARNGIASTAPVNEFIPGEDREREKQVL
jgi:hypothetical protein